MKKIILILAFFITVFWPKGAFLAGISVSGGGEKTVGQTFTVSIVASGANFDSFQGTLSVSGPLEVLAVTPGSATWLPGREPKVGGQFVGITKETSSLTIATLKLKAKSEGTAKVEVTGVKLARAGSLVGESGGAATFTIKKPPELPSAVVVTSPTHPDPNQSYEATTVVLNWTRGKGVIGFAYLLDQNANTTPAAKTTSNETSVTYSNLQPGTYYFHIRAQNQDGFGPTTHFKISIKPPEPKEDPNLTAPSQIKISKAEDFENDVKEGLVKGIIISGKGEKGFEIIALLSPLPPAYAGKTLSAFAADDGTFQIKINEKIPSGFYKLILYGKKDLTLTKKSEEIRFEISQKEGGSINLLTDADAAASSPTPTPLPSITPSQVSFEKLTENISFVSLAIAFLSQVGVFIVLRFFKP
jgi:hypothetical protein